MSKLYDKYVSLKHNDATKLYLFKNGIFYIALNEDAKKLSEAFNFKITNLNETVTKCGFPAKRLEFYTSLLEKLNINFEIVDSNFGKIENRSEYINMMDFKNVVDKLINIDFDNISFKESFDILQNLSEDTKKILNAQNMN